MSPRGVVADLNAEAMAARELLDELLHLGDIAPDDEAAAVEAVEAATDLPAVISEAVRRIREIKAMQAALKVRASDIETRQAQLAYREERIKVAIMGALEIAGLPGARTCEGTVYMSRGQPGVVITGPQDPPADAPERFVRTKVDRSWDRRAIGEALRQGVKLSFASLDNGPRQLVIRR